MGARRVRRRSAGDTIFSFVVYLILIFICLLTILPVMQVITISMSPNDVAGSYGLHLIPFKFSFEGYSRILNYGLIWTSYLNTIKRTILGTAISVCLYILGAYPLSKKYLPNKSFWTVFILFTMYFSGGLIPSYILIVKYLKINNTIWSMVLPHAVSAFTLIVMRNFFEALPDSLEESAKLDGASDLKVLIAIIVPLSKPVIATISLWSIVYHWNTWFDNMLYMSNESDYVLQMVLRRILIMGKVQDIDSMQIDVVNNETMKMATLVVATAPIIAVYPFIQKHFVKGVLIGSVKG